MTPSITSSTAIDVGNTILSGSSVLSQDKAFPAGDFMSYLSSGMRDAMPEQTVSRRSAEHSPEESSRPSVKETKYEEKKEGNRFEKDSNQKNQPSPEQEENRVQAKKQVRSEGREEKGTSDTERKDESKQKDTIEQSLRHTAQRVVRDMEHFTVDERHWTRKKAENKKTDATEDRVVVPDSHSKNSHTLFDLNRKIDDFKIRSFLKEKATTTGDRIETGIEEKSGTIEDLIRKLKTQSKTENNEVAKSDLDSGSIVSGKEVIIHKHDKSKSMHMQNSRDKNEEPVDNKLKLERSRWVIRDERTGKSEAKHQDHDTSVTSDKESSAPSVKLTKENGFSGDNNKQQNDRDKHSSNKNHSESLKWNAGQGEVRGDEFRATESRAMFQPTRDGESVRAGSKDLFNSLVQKAKVNLGNDGKSSASIRLRPESLGQLTMNLNIHHNRVEARLVVESEAARKFLMDELEVLRHELKGHGIHVEQFSIRIRDDSMGRMSSGFGENRNDFTMQQSFQDSAQNENRQSDGSFQDLEAEKSYVSNMMSWDESPDTGEDLSGGRSILTDKRINVSV